MAANDTDPVRHEALENALSSTTDREFDQALQEHGRVQPDEVPALVDALGSWRATRRVRACQLLGLAATPEATDALREHARTTGHVEEWAHAMRAILEEDDAVEMSKARPDMVLPAIDHADPVVASVGLRAGALAGRQDVVEQIRTRLADPQYRVRSAATEAVALSDTRPYEAEIRELLRTERDPGVRTALAFAAVHSEDPQTREAVEQAWLSADAQAVTHYNDAFRRARTAYLRDLVVTNARDPDSPRRRDAVRILAFWGPDRDSMEVCIDLLENMPPRGTQEFSSQMTLRMPCEKMLSEIAGKNVIDAEALEVARKWMADHAQDGGEASGGEPAAP